MLQIQTFHLLVLLKSFYQPVYHILCLTLALLHSIFINSWQSIKVLCRFIPNQYIYTQLGVSLLILYRLPLLIFATAIVYIFIVPEEPFLFRLFFKLLPMALIIAYAFMRQQHKSRMHWLILTGLTFCMLGDGTLHWFLFGLTAFLIGHLFYIAGFLMKWSFSRKRALGVIPISVYAFFMGRQLVVALERNGDTGLVVPVLVYIAVISLMAFAACMTGYPYAIFGSILFLISDSVLAWNMFVNPLVYSGQVIMITYYGAQFLIAHSLFSFGSTKKPLVW